MEEILLFFL